MAIKVDMPKLSDTMEHGTLIKWHVKVGDSVMSGNVLADIETDKATMELQSFDDGVVAALAVEQGMLVPVGGLILVLAQPGETVAAAAAAGIATATATDAVKPNPELAAGDTQTANNIEPSPDASAEEPRPRISPLASHLADEMGVNVANLQGSGPDGRIIKRDILAAAGTTENSVVPTSTGSVGSAIHGYDSGAHAQTNIAASTASVDHAVASAGDRLIPHTSMRLTIAKRLVESKTTIPHFTVTTVVDMELLLGPRGAKAQLDSQGIKVSVNDFVLRAAVLALLRHPLMNASWTPAGVQVHGAVNLGVAVAIPPEQGGGLVVPVVRNAQDRALRDLAAQVKVMSDKARARGLKADDLAGGTFTISNLGMFGVEHFEAIIVPGQAAILAVGAALDKPVIRSGQVVPGKEMTCTISADHRVVDGVTAAMYLQSLKQLLETPAALLV